MMKQSSKWVTACSVLLLFGFEYALAQEKESEEPSVFPVELYLCNYNEGKGPADLDKWADKWNAWADSAALEPYSAWTLTPFYFGPDQDFDFIWLGASPDAKSLGQAYDNYFANSGELQSEFVQNATCSAHSNFATLNIKEPPDDDNSKPFVLSFSDCTVTDGKTFDEHVHPALKAWSEYRTGHGSEAGMWVLWPAYGGGDAEYSFKFVASYPNYASLGVDYDQYSNEGYAKGQELFGGLLECNSSRAYNASLIRDGIPDDE